MTRPMRRPACSRAQGIERREVPIIVFQMAKLRMKIDYKDDDEDDDGNDDDGDDDDDDDDEDDGDDDDEIMLPSMTAPSQYRRHRWAC